MPQNELAKALGVKIRALRREKGYSQEHFADLCGVHRTFMGTIERGESNLSLETMAKVTATLQITLAELLQGVEDAAKGEAGPSA